MRNLFDQYQVPENRLTHALACCLSEDHWLLRRFVAWITDKQATKRARWKVVEQHVPGHPVADFDEEASFGLPDMWIHDDEHWSLIVESKVASPVKADQLRRHLRTAERNGFDDVTLLVISPERPARKLSGVMYRTWTEVFSWMRRRAGRSEWAVRFVDYIQITEERMAADGYLGDRALTEFDGIPFDESSPYSYREAKRTLHLLMSELRQRKDLRKLGMDPEGEGRPAITGRAGESVWDFIPLKAARGQGNFTSHPHLTISIQERRLLTCVIVPNGISARYRRNLTDLGTEGLESLVGEVERGVTHAVRKIERAYPWMEALQRRYPSQRSKPISDARLEFDLRTAVSSRESGVRLQPQWLEATYNALAHKRSNLQLAIGAALPYGSRVLQSRKVLDTIANVWIACSPWLRQVLRGA